MPRMASELGMGECSTKEQKAKTKAKAKRISKGGSTKEADYFLSNYRWHEKEYPYKNEYFSIKVGRAKIMVVYDMSREDR